MQPYTCAYNAKMHKPADTTPFSHVLSRHPLALTRGSQPSELATEKYVGSDPRWLKLNLPRKIAPVQTMANFQLKRSGAQYKRHSGDNEHLESEFVSNQWVSIDKPPFTGNANTADKMAEAYYNKLQSRKARPYQIVNVQTHTVVLEKNAYRVRFHYTKSQQPQD